MFLFASDNYMHQIKLLWKQAFRDTDASTDYYFANIHKHENMLLDVENGTICAMLTMLPIQLRQNGKSENGRYIYAVATRRDFRSQGRSTRLLEYANGYMREQNVKTSLLVPASKELFGFYEKRRYVRAFQVSKSTIFATELPKVDFAHSIELCNTQKYYQIRRKAFAANKPFAEWDEIMLEKVMDYARFCGGVFYALKSDTGEAAVYAVKRGNDVLIKELALSNMCIKDAVAILYEKLNAKKYFVCSAADNGHGTDFAMICNLRDDSVVVENPYFNLAID